MNELWACVLAGLVEDLIQDAGGYLVQKMGGRDTALSLGASGAHWLVYLVTHDCEQIHMLS